MTGRLALLAAMLVVSTPALAADAAYTDLVLDACEVEEVFEEGGGAALRCQGLDGVPVFVSEGDLRFDVDFGARDENFDSFAPFNSLGERVEWRVEEGVPFAAILRFSFETPDADPAAQKGSVLGIFKIGTDEAPGCPIAYVDALLNPEANLIARQVADGFARAFRCGRDRATYIGVTGPLSGNASAISRPPVEDPS